MMTAGEAPPTPPSKLGSSLLGHSARPQPHTDKKCGPRRNTPSGLLPTPDSSRAHSGGRYEAHARRPRAGRGHDDRRTHARPYPSGHDRGDGAAPSVDGCEDCLREGGVWLHPPHLPDCGHVGTSDRRSRGRPMSDGARPRAAHAPSSLGGRLATRRTARALTPWLLRRTDRGCALRIQHARCPTGLSDLNNYHRR